MRRGRVRGRCGARRTTRAAGLRLAASLALAAVSWGAAGPDAAAQVAPQPPVSLAYNNLLAARVNPLGLADYARFTLQLRLYEDESPALAQNYVGAGVSMGLSPAWGRVGPLVEIQPLSVLRLWAQYVFVGYFGTFDLFASFPSASADYSDTAIQQRTETDALQSYVTFGGELTLGATLQFKLGPLAVRSLFRAVYSNYEMRDGDVVFYDQIIDLAVPNAGWYVTNDLDVLGLIDFDDGIQLALGGRYTNSHALYDAGHYRPGEDPDAAPSNDIHRLGPFFGLRLASDPNTRFDSPTIVLLAQWHLVHRFRTGADVTVALPSIVVAFTFRGNLLADR